MTTRRVRVLIIEDGDEYWESLSKFVPGPEYLQAHDGAEALEVLHSTPVDIVYLDMRFDRSPPDRLLGDYNAALQRHQGQPARATRYLAQHQGLFILEALRQAGSRCPVLLAYDFSHEQGRFARLAERHPNLSWLPDAISPEEIQARLTRLTSGLQSDWDAP